MSWFEHVGKATWDDSLAKPRPRSALVQLAATPLGYDGRQGLISAFLAPPALLLGFLMGTKAELQSGYGVWCPQSAQSPSWTAFSSPLAEAPPPPTPISILARNSAKSSSHLNSVTASAGGTETLRGHKRGQTPYKRVKGSFLGIAAAPVPNCNFG